MPLVRLRDRNLQSSTDLALCNLQTQRLCVGESAIALPIIASIGPSISLARSIRTVRIRSDLS